ncbi:MAG: DUF3142 domain-containing protein [Verrucomicrobiia bacterium]
MDYDYDYEFDRQRFTQGVLGRVGRRFLGSGVAAPLRFVLQLAVCGLGLVVCLGEPDRQGLPHEVYVWQRDWNRQVRETVSQRAPDFTRVIALSAEVTWVRRQPRAVRVPLDYAVLRQTGRSIGLALRIGPYPGPFEPVGEPIEALSALARLIVEEAGANGLQVSELQIDFDCAESKLDGYRTWIGAIRKRVALTPISITALPSWLRKPGFKELVAAADNYVLQVHSLDRPKDIGATFALCDPVAARRAVDLAGQVGVSFRVALPTYGYLIAFSAGGKFLGLSAEGPSPGWPPDVRTREVRADPASMAGLVRHWSTNRPGVLKGVTWFRLPVAGDRLNWPWPTLAAVMEGRAPVRQLQAEVSRPDRGLVHITLLNSGETEYALVPPVSVHWTTARLLAADALHGFSLTSQGPRGCRFEPGLVAARGLRILPGEKYTIGWLRLSAEDEVQASLEQPKPAE